MTGANSRGGAPELSIAVIWIHPNGTEILYKNTLDIRAVFL